MRPRGTAWCCDDITLQNLKALAARRHKGNVSALLAELAGREGVQLVEAGAVEVLRPRRAGEVLHARGLRLAHVEERFVHTDRFFIESNVMFRFVLNYQYQM